MKQYLLTVYQPDGPAPAPEFLGPIMQRVEELRREMQGAGAWVFAGGLEAPTSAKVLRSQDGRVLVTDGPFTETKEHVGGFTVVRAADREAALEWGRKLARATTLPIEVRELCERNAG